MKINFETAKQLKASALIIYLKLCKADKELALWSLRVSRAQAYRAAKACELFQVLNISDQTLVVLAEHPRDFELKNEILNIQNPMYIQLYLTVMGGVTNKQDLLPHFSASTLSRAVSALASQGLAHWDGNIVVLK